MEDWMNNNDPLKDSGDRREFETGAVRDMLHGKGRCDLLPACAIMRLSKHYEKGAVKYQPRNWEKGIPISCFLDSGIRHLLKYLDGQDDEDHLAAAAWNILGAMWMEEKKPELQDIPAQMSKVKDEEVSSCMPDITTGDGRIFKYDRQIDEYKEHESFIKWLKGKRYTIDEDPLKMTCKYRNEHQWELSANSLINDILTKLKED